MNKLKIAAEWAVCIMDIVLGIAFVVLLLTTLSNISKSKFFRNEGTREYILKEIEREDYGAAGIESRAMRRGANIDEPMQEFYMVGSYADLMFWERIYAESGSEAAAEECRLRCEEIRNSLPEYGNVFEKIDDRLETAVTRKGPGGTQIGKDEGQDG